MLFFISNISSSWRFPIGGLAAGLADNSEFPNISDIIQFFEYVKWGSIS